MDHDSPRVTAEGTTESTPAQHDSLAERGRRLYDRWADNQLFYDLIARANAPAREQACAHLDLSRGERVLEIGCGPGVNLGMLAEGVGSEGAVVGVDYSEKMVQRATASQREHERENVEVVRGDATQVSFEPETFDAALASLVLSVIPAPEDVIESVYSALKPGGRFVVFDAAARYHDGPMQLLNPIHTRFVRYAFNHQQQNVIAELQAVFDRVTIVETFRAESEYIVVAIKQPNST